MGYAISDVPLALQPHEDHNHTCGPAQGAQDALDGRHVEERRSRGRVGKGAMGSDNIRVLAPCSVAYSPVSTEQM